MKNKATEESLPANSLHVQQESTSPTDVHPCLDISGPNDLSIPSLSHLTSDFEAVLTHFARTYNLEYVPNNGWLPILTTIHRTLEPLDRSDLYAFFVSVHHRFIAAGYNTDNRACTVLHLLLQYHEPKLCNLLDSFNIGPELYARSWLTSLFASVVNPKCVVPLWDIIFLVSDPLFTLFISLVFLLNSKSILFDEEEEQNAENIAKIPPYKKMMRGRFLKNNWLAT
ncbi:unnamed protein product [Protopolystoma xenopodis]|uniref:Rab-GAP TBC domain-containing protein n=1 Tax=Protopolystoma xenopodis TaxID=117903 RepID=A0A448WLW0_9PLAT|nr:unnamed protein product [Protopolystoma xenopodis]